MEQSIRTNYSSIAQNSYNNQRDFNRNDRFRNMSPPIKKMMNVSRNGRNERNERNERNDYSRPPLNLTASRQGHVNVSSTNLNSFNQRECN